jgi:hypothetical protein
MENSITDLIVHFEVERTQAFRLIDNLGENKDKSLEFIEMGKIFALNDCIEKLQELLDSQKKKITKK